MTSNSKGSMMMRRLAGRTVACMSMACAALVLSVRPAAAQTTYQYTGNPFTFFSCGPNANNTATMDCFDAPAPGNTNTSYTATNHVTATLTFDAPLDPNLTYTDVTSVAGFQLTMNDGQQTLTTPVAGLIVKVSTDGNGNIIGPWLLVMNVGNVADSGISSENEPPVSPFVQDTGVLACCDPTIHGDLALNQSDAGTWSSGSQTPAQMVTSLITVVQGMNIPQQGTSLVDQLNQVEADITTQNGLACQDLIAFAKHVKAQTGKTITAAQASQLLAAVADIEAALGCGV